MSAPKTGIQIKILAANQEISKDEEKNEMWMTSNITKVKTWASQSLSTQHPIKLLGMVVLGASKITVTGRFQPG